MIASTNKVSLGDICEIVGSLVDPKQVANRTMLHVGGANIVSQTGELIDLKTAEQEELISGKHFFTADDVLYSKIRPYLRKVALPDFTGLSSADIYPLRPREGKITREYLYFLLQSEEFTHYAIRVSNRAGMPKINREQLFAFTFSLPDIENQLRVVSRIKELMQRVNAIESLSRSVSAELTELKRSLVIGQHGGKQHPQRLSELVEWVQNAEVVIPHHQYTFAGIMSFGRGLFTRGVVISDDFAYKSLHRLRAGDFIYPKLMAWEGAFAMVTEQHEGMVVSPEFVVFRPKANRICSEVLDTYFRSPGCLEDVGNASTGSNRRRRRLNPKAFLALYMPVPTEDNQRKLKAVYRVEAEVEKARENRHEELNALRDAILRKAFAGDL